jgi:hypothetical protein
VWPVGLVRFGPGAPYRDRLPEASLYRVKWSTATVVCEPVMPVFDERGVVAHACGLGEHLVPAGRQTPALPYLLVRFCAQSGRPAWAKSRARQLPGAVDVAAKGKLDACHARVQPQQRLGERLRRSRTVVGHGWLVRCAADVALIAEQRHQPTELPDPFDLLG